MVNKPGIVDIYRNNSGAMLIYCHEPAKLYMWKLETLYWQSMTSCGKGEAGRP
jgi:hypothetical protein